MIIDSPRPEDIPHLRRLWKEAFGDTDAFLDRFFSLAFSPRRSRCLRIDGVPVAGLYWFDCLRGEQPVAYIYAVATATSYRGQGLCHRLMEDTHRLLQSQGYSGAVLVPGNAGLFRLYETLGYRAFCPMMETTVTAQGSAYPVQALSKESYVNYLDVTLPPDSVRHTGPALDLLAAEAAFYRAGDTLFSATREGDTLYFQEFLGDPELLPRILTALGVARGIVRLPGGKPYAMYLPLASDLEAPAYFGIPLN